MPTRTDLPPPASEVGTSRIMTLYGQTMTRTGSIFAFGLAAVVPFGILSIAVTTRYLAPDEYGHLAVLFAVASFVTMFCGIGFLQGTMISVYGIADDGDGDGDGEVDGFDATVREMTLVEAAAGPEEKKRLLGSGLLVVVATTSLLCGAVGLIGAPLATALFGSGWVGPVLWMAASAWAGGLWRLMHQIPRMERHSIRWAVLQWARPALVVLGTWLALAAGLGVSGVLMATALGTLAATAIAFVVSRHSFRVAPRRGDLAYLWKAGRAWVPLIFAVAVQTNISVFLLGILATPSSVALFQVATRISQFPIYFADGFVTAWPAMERSPISLAAKAQKGLREYSAAAFTLLALSTLGLLVMVSLFADALIHIAAPSYRSAASLIPIVAAGAAAHVAFRGVFRATGFSRRRYWYTFLHLLWVAPYAAVTALLVPLNASYGVAIAQLAAGITVTVCFVLLDRHSEVTTPFQWRRLGLALLVASGCVAVSQSDSGRRGRQGDAVDRRNCRLSATADCHTSDPPTTGGHDLGDRRFGRAAPRLPRGGTAAPVGGLAERATSALSRYLRALRPRCRRAPAGDPGVGSARPRRPRPAAVRRRREPANSLRPHHRPLPAARGDDDRAGRAGGAPACARHRSPRAAPPR